MRAATALRGPTSTGITTSSCTFYKLDKCFTAEEPDVFLVYVGARILQFRNPIIHETIIPSRSVPPGHAAAGKQACGGRYGGPGVRSPF